MKITVCLHKIWKLCIKYIICTSSFIYILHILLFFHYFCYNSFSLFTILLFSIRSQLFTARHSTSDWYYKLLIYVSKENFDIHSRWRAKSYEIGLNTSIKKSVRYSEKKYKWSILEANNGWMIVLDELKQPKINHIQ